MDNELTSTTTEELTTQEPSTSEEDAIDKALDEIDGEQEDNSDDSDDLVADVEEAGQENKVEDKPKADEPKDKSQTDFPDKFKKEDGTPDYDKLLNSYKELETNFTKKTQELNDQLKTYQEQEEQAKQEQLRSMGYDSQLDYEISLYSAKNLAENYAQYLEYSDDPEYTRQLLVAYAQEPTRSLLEQIEDNFGVDVIKEVTKQNSIYTDNLINSYQQQQQNEYNNRIIEESRVYVTNAVNEFPDWFKKQEFVDFFGDALKVKGDTFEAAAFVNHVQKIWDLAQKTLLEEMQSNKENKSEIQALANQTPKTSSSGSTKRLEDMTESELASAINEYI